ncbi:hypothetical protein ACVWZV_009728 [Bradyrhizobium sp. GM5.1]
MPKRACRSSSLAFAVTADHGRQEQVWQTISGSWQKEPYLIRRMLTEKSARASDRRAMFVGLDAYEAAGGVVLRNPFQSDDGGWLEDVALLDGLVAEKRKAEAETDRRRRLEVDRAPRVRSSSASTTAQRFVAGWHPTARLDLRSNTRLALRILRPRSRWDDSSSHVIHREIRTCHRIT